MTIDVKDAAGVTRAIEAPNANGRASAAGSRPVVLSNEDVAELEAIRSAILGTLVVSAATLPLPDGAATQATLAAVLAKLTSDPATQTTLDAVRALLAGTLTTSAAAPTYAVKNVAALTANQAAGTDPILAANATRKGLIVVPPVDCRLKITNDSSTATGYPLFANVPNEIYLPGVPANALYVVGLSAGAALTIWEG